MILSQFICTLLLAPVLSSCDASIEPMPPFKGVREKKGEQTGTWHEKAYATYQVVERLYGVKTGAAAGLFRQNYPIHPGDADASDLWNYDGIVSGIAGLNSLGYEVDYAAKVENYERYLSNIAPGGWGYASMPGGSGDRYYDDNSIVGINLVEAYRQLQNPVYLERCARIVSFLRSGVDNTFGGGLWWCEQYKNIPGQENSNKPACANGFAQWFLLSYYEICPDAEKASVLSFAQELYEWVYNNLRDDRNLYLNQKNVDGTIQDVRWTYNSGAMIAAGLRLYRITGQQRYLDEAIATADASYDYFTGPKGDIPLSYPLNDPWFNVKLIRAYIELLPEHPACANYIGTFVSNLDRAWLNGRQTNGLWYEDWSGVPNEDGRDDNLLMQDAAIESLCLIALYENEHKEQ